MLRPDAHVYCLYTVCQRHFDSLDLRDMRRLLDDATGESGPCGAALSQSRGGSCNTHPVYYSGPHYGEGLSGAALYCGCIGNHTSALVPRAALPLGQVGQSHGGMDFPPALVLLSLLAPILLLVPVNIQF